jgi:hypothetical protein
MSDVSQGPGWWLASDGKWYPPEQGYGAGGQPWPPSPSFVETAPTPASGAVPPVEAVPAAPAGTKPGSKLGGAPIKVVAVGVVALVVGIVVGIVVAPGKSSTGGSGSTTSTAAGPSTLGQGEAALKKMVVQQSDVPAGTTVQLVPGGDRIANEATLTLCGAKFASESQRVARYEVSATNAIQHHIFSTEAVLYRDPAATTAAFHELQHVVATCPQTFVPSVVAGQPAMKTVFGPGPDLAMPQYPGESRLALQYTVTELNGATTELATVFIRRGPYLLGIYLEPGLPLIPVDGQTTIQGISLVFEQRLAEIPVPSS